MPLMPSAFEANYDLLKASRQKSEAGSHAYRTGLWQPGHLGDGEGGDATRSIGKRLKVRPFSFCLVAGNLRPAVANVDPSTAVARRLALKVAIRCTVPLLHL